MSLLTDLLTAVPADALVHMPDAKEIPGVASGVNRVIGWILWGISVLSIVGLLFVAGTGYSMYRHNQGEQFMEKAKAWLFGAVIGSNATYIVQVFYPAFTLQAQPTAIPGLQGPVSDIIGNVVWILGIAAFVCIIFIAGKGFLAYRDGNIGEFVDKFLWFIVGSLVVAFASQIAGAFFPAAILL